MKRGRYFQQRVAHVRWWLVLSSLLVLICPLLLLAETKEERTKANAIYKRVFPVGVRPNKDALNSLTGDERQLLIERLRNAIDVYRKQGENEASLGGHPSTLQLAMLGDDKAMEMVVANFLASPRWGTPGAELKKLNDPRVIPLIGESLFKNEVDELPPGGDVGFIRTQKVVGEVTLHILGNSPEFTAEVINWARRLSAEKRFPFDEIPLLRNWYRANETKLKAGDFKAVQTGEDPSETKPSAPFDGQLPPPSSSTAIPPALPTLISGDSQTHAATRNGFLWIAAALLAISGSLIWLLKRNRN